MTDSKITLAGTDYNFQGEEKYHGNWLLWVVEQTAPLPGGAAVVPAADLSLTTRLIRGFFVSTDSLSADKAVHVFEEALIDSMAGNTTAVITYQVTRGTLVYTGVILSLDFDRNSPDGEESIPFQIEIQLTQKPDYSGLSS